MTTALPIGTLLLDRYRITEPLATGGNSVVYRALDERLARDVCVKIFALPEGDAGVARTSYEHFIQEAFAMSRLSHPNTLKVFDFGHLPTALQADEATAPQAFPPPFFVCEFLEGGTLTQLVRDGGPLPFTDGLQILLALCDALSEAHGAGIVHRDIKPQNILFAKIDGRALPKLADFGIAKWSGDSYGQPLRANDTQIVAGRRLTMYSPSWAAPEQVAGLPVTAAGDVFSLATVAVYMFTGEAIFFHEDILQSYELRRDATPLLAQALARAPHAMPAALREVLQRALTFHPDERLADAAAFSAALRSLEPQGHYAPVAAPMASTVAPSPSPSPLPVAVSPSPLQASSEPHRSPSRPTVQSAGLASPAFRADDAALRAEPPECLPGASLHERARTALPLPWQDDAHVAGRRIEIGNARDGVEFAINAAAKIRVSVLWAPHRIIHIKGQGCFVAKLGGRPAPGIACENDAGFVVVGFDSKVITQAIVHYGSQSAEGTAFELPGVGGLLVPPDAHDPFFIELGVGGSLFCVYTVGKPPVKVRR